MASVNYNLDEYTTMVSVHCFELYILVFGVICSELILARDNDIQDIQFRYYNGKTYKQYIIFNLANFSKLSTFRSFKRNNYTVVYIHGYEENAGSPSVRTIASAYLDYRPRTNVITVDWGNMATGAYITNAALNTDTVGRAVGHSLLNIMTTGMLPNHIHIVSFSLGCHVAASIARTTKTSGVTLARITGLDCAFAMFYPVISGRRLTSDAAVFVDSIHTDSMMYGAPMSSGHAAFWVNGGMRRQPGCSEINVFVTLGAESFTREKCSHYRSWKYYAESVKTPKAFRAVECSKYEKFQKNRCFSNDFTYMGYGASSKHHGNFYLSTNDKPPFGRGARGVKALIKK